MLKRLRNLTLEAHRCVGFSDLLGAGRGGREPADTCKVFAQRSNLLWRSSLALEMGTRVLLLSGLYEYSLHRGLRCLTCWCRVRWAGRNPGPFHHKLSLL